MAKPPLNVGLIEDNPADAALFKLYLERRGLVVRAYTTWADAERAFALREHDVFLMDWNLSKGTAAQLVNKVRPVPVVVLSGGETPTTRWPAFDKNQEPDKLVDELIAALHAAARDARSASQRTQALTIHGIYQLQAGQGETLERLAETMQEVVQLQREQDRRDATRAAAELKRASGWLGQLKTMPTDAPLFFWAAFLLGVLLIAALLLASVFANPANTNDPTKPDAPVEAPATPFHPTPRRAP